MAHNLVDETEKISWKEFIKQRKKLDIARATYTQSRTLDTIENLAKASEKFMKALQKWQKDYEAKIRRNSVYIPARE